MTDGLARRVYARLDTEGPLPLRDIADALGARHAAVYDALRDLRTDGHVTTVETLPSKRTQYAATDTPPGLPTNPVDALFALADGEYVHLDAWSKAWVYPWRVDAIDDAGETRELTLTNTYPSRGQTHTVTVTRGGHPPKILQSYGRIHRVQCADGPDDTRDDVTSPPTAPASETDTEVFEALADVDGPLSARQLTGALDASRTSINYALSRLADAERVLSTRNPDDRRVVEYRLVDTAPTDALAYGVSAAQTLEERIREADTDETETPTNACDVDGCEYVGETQTGLSLHETYAHGTSNTSSGQGRGDLRPRACGVCGMVVSCALGEAVHGVRVHHYTPDARLEGHTPTEFSAIFRESESVGEAASALGMPYEKALRLMGILDLDYLLVPDAARIEWDRQGKAVAADGGGDST